jgi:hypothetical protein
VKQDAVEGYKWVTLAANQNDHVAVETLADMEKRMTPAQIAEARRRAAEWKPAPALSSSNADTGRH